MDLTRSQKRYLKNLFPDDDCLFDRESKHVFGTDSSRLFASPWAVVRPKEVSQIQDLLRWAERECIPIIPRSRGTNMVGGTVPQGGGIVVSMLAMNSILEINEKDFVAVVEPGVVTADLQKKTLEKHLLYPPDPASVKFSTIGGNVSTNAGGMRAVKYGVTRDYVLGLEAVLPGGEIIRTGGRCHKNVVGLDLTGILVGSEGTLALITRIFLKLLPLPQTSGSILLAFDSLDGSLDLAAEMFSLGVLPVTIEIMGREVLKALGMVGKVPWPEGAEAALLIKMDGRPETVTRDLELLEDLAQAKNCSLALKGTGAEEDALWETRRMISPASFRIRPDKMSEDVAVPRGRVRHYLHGVQRLSAENDVPILTFGHLGDGNIHTNIMYDRRDNREKENAERARSMVLDLVLSLEGTLSGEHGIGLAKRGRISRQLSQRERKLMRDLKSQFDPKGIMNPGKGY